MKNFQLKSVFVDKKVKILVTIQIDYDDEIGSFSCDALIYQIISKINGLTFETLDLFLFERM